MTLSIILPVFNEVKSLEHVISIWSKYLVKGKIIHEFVLCEDGSTDGTKELIKKLEKKKSIKQVLVTTSTLSSSKIFEKFRFKKKFKK